MTYIQTVDTFPDKIYFARSSFSLRTYRSEFDTLEGLRD